MKERPILFSAPMVRALLDGRKTQTRRLVKDSRGLYAFTGDRSVHPAVSSIVDRGDGKFIQEAGEAVKQQYISTFPFHSLRCPYGRPGDRLWVRETWNTSANVLPPIAEPYIYGADLGPTGLVRWAARWRPSIHMPRAASRITLGITGVRVERLQDISYADILAEGVRIGVMGDLAKAEALPIETKQRLARDAWWALWTSINGDDSWKANPWVWVVELKRVNV